MLNPRVVAEAADSDEQYEGCLSFFDVRGLEVEHTMPNGQQMITCFVDGQARLVAHEVDRLYGRLYTSRMRPGVHPIPVEEYRESGQPWTTRRSSG
ncbi:peptide deformylase [Rhizohabitans arisaemae]|uniref:peptide deformylase n=1 Tax=Rhizohabitans arisaemae TaxID=2720610 RepID=UPI0024B18171|nr:peptide deformylase [Rhizohabitans arisaemae]